MELLEHDLASEFLLLLHDLQIFLFLTDLFLCDSLLFDLHLSLRFLFLQLVFHITHGLAHGLFLLDLLVAQLHFSFLNFLALLL